MAEVFWLNVLHSQGVEPHAVELRRVSAGAATSRSRNSTRRGRRHERSISIRATSMASSGSLMLREDWDVRNVCVIVGLRK
jgi:hypothetical protein